MGSTKPANRSDPFGDTADTRFYWCGDARSAPLAQVEAAINSGNVAIACAGATGSGKTAFLCKLAEQLWAAGVRFIHPGGVVSCRNARASSSRGPRAWEGSKESRALRPQGKTAEVLLLDDVDQLSRDEMAQLHDWWHILRDKRQQVALVVSCAASAVDPDSASRRHDLRSMIDTVVALPPLSHADIEEVIRYRLDVAGREWGAVFTQSALDKVAFYAKGTPKRLVQICSRVMALAEEGGTFPAGPDLVKEAAHQLFLPNHLREFSRKISMGLVPVPASLGEAATEPAPAPEPTPSPAPAPTSAPAPAPQVETRFERRAYVEPRAPLTIARGAGVGLLDAVQDRRVKRPDEAAAVRPRPPDAAEQDFAIPEFGSPPVAKRRRRGTVSVVVICGIAIVTGALGYVVGQTDMKPVEVVRIIPLSGITASEDAGDAGTSGQVSDEAAASSPAPEIAPSPQGAEPIPESVDPAPQGAEPIPESVDPAPQVAEPVPESVGSASQVAEPVPESVGSASQVAEPVPEGADPAPQVAEPVPEGADPAPQVAEPIPESVDPAPQVAEPVPEGADPASQVAEPIPESVDPAPQVAEPVPEGADLEADIAVEAPQPDPAQDDAELEVQAEAADGGPSPAAAEAANEDGRAEEFFSGLRMEGSDDEASVSGLRDDGTAVESESTDTAAQSPVVTQQSDVPATTTAAKEEEFVRNDGPDDSRSAGGAAGQGAGAPAAEQALASAPAGEEPTVTWQFDRTVMRAQTLLAQLELYRGAIDGLLGSRTVAAIRDFQRGMSMAESGELSEALLAALEQQASTAGSGPPVQEHAQGHYDAVVDAAEDLEVIDIMSECRGKDAEWVYIAAINRHVLCGGLSVETPNLVRAR